MSEYMHFLSISETANQDIPPQELVLPYEDGLFPVLFLSSEYQTVEDRLKYVKEFEYKPDDVLICTYPKCGTHWTGHLIMRLLRVNDDAVIPEVARPLEDSHYDYETKHSPRAICTHLRPKRLPQEHLTNGGKIVVCLRNPKDAAVSSFHHTNSVRRTPGKFKWDTHVENVITGNVRFVSIIDYILEWDKVVSADTNPNVLVIFYEDLLTNGLTTLRRVQYHLGVNKSDECLLKILSECSFKTLQQEASKFEAKDIWPPFLSRDGKYAIYRKGQIGDWKNHFTVAQSEAFDRMMQEKLRYCTIGQRFLTLT